jgi:o-succinylbenzoate synthase
MKINRITLRHLRMTLRSPFETSFGRIQTRDCILIEAASGDLLGYGECVADRDPGYSYETVETAWHILRDFLIPSILEQEIVEPAEVHEHLGYVRGHPMTKAGLEMAFWDLAGKSSGKSLRSLFNGELNKVEVGVSVGIQESPAALLRTVEEYVKQGYRRIKLKIKPGRDIAEVRTIRQAFPHLQLQVDANSAYRLDQSLELKPLDELNLLMIEQPLEEDDLWDHRLLQEQLLTPICLDESITSARHARQAIEMKACRIINIKAGRVGGLSQAIQIHDFCRGVQIPVWCGGMLETGVGRASNLALASLPGFSLPGDISASNRYYLADITNEEFTLNPDSTIDVPAGSGLGITINQENLEDATLSKLSLP